MGDEGNTKNKGGTEEEKEKTEFTPREYQIEILEQAKTKNVIACLGTGTGKTFIAVLLIREMAHHVQVPFANGGKRIFFLVPTVPLVDQQAKFIGEHTELKVKGYFGEMKVDTWNADVWTKEFEEQQVLVMTGEVCRIILHHSFLPVSRICLLILDECHQARGNSPYSKVMEHIVMCDVEPKPRVFGLSASLINDKCKPQNLEKEIEELECTLQSSIVTASDYADVLKYATDAKEFVILYRSLSVPISFKGILERMNSTYTEIKIKAGYKNGQRGNMDFYGEDIAHKPEQCLVHVINILESLGQWCAYTAAEMLCRGLERNLQRLNQDGNNDTIKVRNILLEFLKLCEKNGADSFIKSLYDLPHKLRKLIETLRALNRRSEKMKELEIIEKSKNAEKNITFEEDPHLYAQNTNISESESNLCGIIFVEQRIMAYVLCEWLQRLRESNDEFEFVKADYIFGQGLSNYELSKDFLMSAKKQKEIIDRFRKKEFNFLVATSVLEEGLDVQKCNFVIRFDFPSNFRAYIQSKGRARAHHSVYLLFVLNDERMKYFIDLSNYLSVERMLMKICNQREVPEYVDLDEDTVPPYIAVTAEGSPRITMSAAVSLLHRYCSLLPCDMSVRLKPHFKIKEVDPDATKKLYICTLYLPINSALHDPIKGPEMKSKKTAKMAAALEACKNLHKINELDGHLLPVGKCVDDAAKELGVLEEEKTSDNCKPGTNKRRQCYKKGVADIFKNSLPAAGVPCYLHVFVMDLVVPLPLCLNPRQRPIVNPADTPQTFGLLLTKKLPKVCKFPVFTKCGKILVEIKGIEKSFTLNNDELQNIVKFHRFVFEDTLWLTSKDSIEFSQSGAEFGAYIVPVNKGQERNFYIDMDFICLVLSNKYVKEKDMEFKQIPRKKFNADDFKDAVLSKTYSSSEWKTKKPNFYYITQVRYDFSPQTPLEKDASKTHKEHYKTEYEIDILYDDQPLLDVHMEPSLNKSKPKYISVDEIFKDSTKQMSQSKLSHKNYREYLVPELCFIHPFPDSVFRKATCIPTILFRLNSLLIADQIRQEVAASVCVGNASLSKNFVWPVFHLETSDRKLHQVLVSEGHISDEHYGYQTESADIIKQDGEITSFEAEVNLRDHPGPNPSLLLQALTTKSADDEFHLERLETIGDSFLKFAVSVKLFSAYPSFDEGKLTSLRMRFIRNLNLYQLAKKKNLPQVIFNAPFKCLNPKKSAEKSRDMNTYTNWLAPCYICKTENSQSACEKSENEMGEGKKKARDKKKLENNEVLYTQQIMSDKCIADSVEALIGAYLLSCGHQGALRFMYWIGVDPYVKAENEETNFENWPPVPPDPLRKKKSEVQDMTNLFNFTEFEKRIGYKFKQPAYLLQAFTHASCGISFNDLTDCYQRLEFLGDAVLDYLITRTLYEDPEEHSPGELTDLRSALVNNAYFASLAIKFGYHKNLRCLSITLLKMIKEYISVVENSEAFKYFEDFGYYLEETECLDIDQVEVPKALGDVFESVAGAIYLDSGSSLDEVWRIYYPMMKPAIDHLCTHVPKSPIRLLYELTDDQKIFSNKKVKVQGDKTYIHVQLNDGTEFVGTGPNKKVAKISAAKQALAHVKKKVGSKKKSKRMN